MTPQLAINWIEDRVRFPVIVQPKIDGVRGLNIDGVFTGRSLKPFKNKATTKFYSKPEYAGLDGECVLPGTDWTEPGMCRLTTGLLGRIEDPMVADWIAFDLLTPATINKPYTYRYGALLNLAKDLGIHVFPCYTARNMGEVLELDSGFLSKGYEGSILRDPKAVFKPGRSGSNGMELWRIKRFTDFEIRVTELIEAQENKNEAKTNALGHTERSSHKANKTGKGMVGTIRGTVHKAVVHNGKVLFQKGMVIDSGPGELTHAERVHYWQNPGHIIGKLGKVKTFPHGVLDKPRMPTFLGVREDL